MKKYWVLIGKISLGVTLFSHLNGILGLFFHRLWSSGPPALYMLSNITFNYIVVFDEIVIAGLLVIALLTYRNRLKIACEEKVLDALSPS